MTTSRGLRQKVIFMAVLMTYGLVLFSVAHYLNLKIGLTTTPGDVVLQGFVNSRETGERLVAKIRESMGKKSSEGIMRIEERK